MDLDCRIWLITRDNWVSLVIGRKGRTFVCSSPRALNLWLYWLWNRNTQRTTALMDFGLSILSEIQKSKVSPASARKTRLNEEVAMTQEYFSNWTTCWPDGFRTLSEILMAPSLPPHHYEVIETGKQRVSDTLTNVDDFSKACAVLIDAPTGSGKSTFVLKTLSQYAQKQSKYILFLSNRSTLNFQNKLLASAGKPKVGPTALSNIKVVGNFVLCTYQDILHMLSHIDGITLQTRVGMCPREVGYVVLDEANFFCSDATFNGKTSRILREVIMKYYMCPRIYMSATMGDVRPLILHEEQFARSLYPTAHTDQCRFMWNAGHPLIKDYRFESDYSSIHLHF